MAHESEFTVSPDDPRAPSQEQWDKMTPAQRHRGWLSLPSEVPLDILAPEGDPHRTAKERAVHTLDSFFRRVGRQVYVSSELMVYYPAGQRFAPDVLAVLDVSAHERTKWVVSHEGKGLDFVLEVHIDGSVQKDYVRNRKLYASLGIPEYFLLDRTKNRLFGWRLRQPSDRVYTPIMPQRGLFTSRVLGMDLTLEDDKLRFLYGLAPVPHPEELVERLETLVDEIEKKRELEVKQAREAKEKAEQERAEALERVRELEELLRKERGES